MSKMNLTLIVVKILTMMPQTVAVIWMTGLILVAWQITSLVGGVVTILMVALDFLAIVIAGSDFLWCRVAVAMVMMLRIRGCRVGHFRCI